MMLKWDTVPFAALNAYEFHAIIQLRIAIFVVEQNCPYQELDGKDIDAFHILGKDNDMLIATARILKKGVSYPEWSIGRVVVAETHRENKVGYELMNHAIRFIHNIEPNAAIRISAQSHLEAFYMQFGFVSTGKKYDEDGIPHVEMLGEFN